MCLKIICDVLTNHLWEKRLHLFQLSDIILCLNLKGFFKLGFSPCKAKQPLQGMEWQKKEAKKD